jgi:DNA-binding winged helix-turn-helix (wHTH) protein
MKVSFGECLYDRDTRLLLRRGQSVPLSPKAFELLGLLLAARPRAVSKADLQEDLWPDTFVLEANLPNLIAELRSAIGENARRPAFIRTVHGFGYAFSGPAVEAGDGAGATVDGAAPVCYVAWAGEHVLLGPGEPRVGRSPDSSVWLRSSSVSRHHACIRVTGTEASLQDLGSKNGTFLEGRPVVNTASPLADGNEIRCGSVVLRFHSLPLLATTDSGSLSS